MKEADDQASGGGGRIILGSLLIFSGMIVIVLFGLTGWHWRGAPASQWVDTYMARGFNRIFNVRLAVEHRERLTDFQGFIVANHISYLDIVSLMATQPLRMLAAAEVKSKPVIGWAASGAGAVYVDRSSLRSRRDAMMSILRRYQAEKDPPIAVFVEGSMGTGECLSFTLSPSHPLTSSHDLNPHALNHLSDIPTILALLTT